jgi:uncharacterized iron-regulated membrane protein
MQYLSKAHTAEDPPAGLWLQWLRRPRNTWFRKAAFQLHLWSGILLGFYAAVVCASGSAIVFRNDIYDWLESGGKAVSYKAALYHWLSWLGKLHGSLLTEGAGMTVNAIGGFLIAALCLTGMIVWWPGLGRWRRALTIHANVGWKRFIFDLHGALGFWTFAVLLMWGLTGGYFVFPQPFRAAITLFTPIDAPPALRPAAPNLVSATVGGSRSTAGRISFPRRRPLTLGARILRGFSLAHYGNFGGWAVKTLWVILGLVPAVLFSTALLMWCSRVLAPAMRRLRQGPSRPPLRG